MTLIIKPSLYLYKSRPIGSILKNNKSRPNLLKFDLVLYPTNWVPNLKKKKKDMAAAFCFTRLKAKASNQGQQ